MIKLKEIYDKIIEEIEPQEYEIYSDMDGVLVDFNARYKDLTGKDPNLHRYISFKRAQKNPKLSKDEIQFQVNTEFWKPITDEGIGYWEGMDWMPDGKKYWNYIKNTTLNYYQLRVKYLVHLKKTLIQEKVKENGQKKIFLVQN